MLATSASAAAPPMIGKARAAALPGIRKAASACRRCGCTALAEAAPMVGPRFFAAQPGQAIIREQAYDDANDDWRNPWQELRRLPNREEDRRSKNYAKRFR